MKFSILKKILQLVLILGLFLILAIVVLFVYFNLPGPAPREDVSFGVTFSQKFANEMELDWQETYLAMLTDLGVRKIRLPVYWDLVEKNKDEYDFTDIDWQLDEAQKRNAEVILVVGQRVPRWPECHIPVWIESDEQRKKDLLEFIDITVKRYQNYDVVKIWQVENEPFLPFFGVCPAFDEDLLEEEIKLVKMNEKSRPILLTDSGELSLWVQAAEKADIFGTTMYRTIWKEGLGYFTYPVGPNFFRFKYWLIKTFAGQENAIVIELQGEPWAYDFLGDVPLEEQIRLMNEDKLEENIEYAKQVGFDENYLWGVEWWYWLKTKKDYPFMWEKAKIYFNK